MPPKSVTIKFEDSDEEELQPRMKQVYQIASEREKSSSDEDNDPTQAAQSMQQESIPPARTDLILRTFDLETAVTSVGFLPDQKAIATADKNNTVVIWDIKNGTKLFEKTEDHKVNSVALHMLKYKFQEDASKSEMLDEWTNPYSTKPLAFSSDLNYVCKKLDISLVIVQPSNDYSLEARKTFFYHFQCHTLFFSPNDRYICTVSQLQIQVFEFNPEIRVEHQIALCMINLQWPCCGVAFSPTSLHLIYADKDYGYLIDIERGTSIRRFDQPHAWNSSVAFSPTNAHVCMGSTFGNIDFWETGLVQSQEQLQVALPVYSLKPHETKICCIAYSASGDLLCSASEDGIVKVWVNPFLHYTYEKRALFRTQGLYRLLWMFTNPGIPSPQDVFAVRTPALSPDLIQLVFKTLTASDLL